MKGIVKKNPNIISQKDNETGGVDYILENGSWLGESFNYLPSGIIDKRETGIGATTLEIECYRHSIIIEPLRITVVEKAINNPKVFAYLVEDKKINVKLHEYLRDEKIEHKARMKKILKPEQFQKWEQHQENRTKKVNQKRKNNKEKRKVTQKTEE